MHAYLTKFVIARISGSFLYGLALGGKKGLICSLSIKHYSFINNAYECYTHKSVTDQYLKFSLASDHAYKQMNLITILAVRTFHECFSNSACALFSCKNSSTYKLMNKIHWMSFQNNNNNNNKPCKNLWQPANLCVVYITRYTLSPFTESNLTKNYKTTNSHLLRVKGVNSRLHKHVC